MDIFKFMGRVSASGMSALLFVVCELVSVPVAQAGVVRYAIAGEFVQNKGIFPYPYAGSFLGEFSFDRDEGCGDEGNLSHWSVHVSDDPTSNLAAFDFDSRLPNSLSRWRLDCGTFYTFLIADTNTQRGFEFSIIFDDGGRDYFWGNGVDEVPFQGTRFDDPPSAGVVSRFVNHDRSRVWAVSEPTTTALVCLALSAWVATSIRRRGGRAVKREGGECKRGDA